MHVDSQSPSFSSYNDLHFTINLYNNKIAAQFYISPAAMAAGGE
jgi:hypothetical protein